MITIDRKVVELVLDALQQGITEMNHRGSAIECMPLHIAAKALRDAVLAQPAAQPTEPVQITDQMAYAFHAALGDGSIGADDVNEIKTGLAAAFAHITAQPTEPAGEPVAFVVATRWNDADEVTRFAASFRDNANIKTGMKLYTRPAVPLTDEQIDRAIAELGLNYLADAANNRAVLRELCRKAAHKIGGAQ
jgi:hypothetical protein